MAFSRTDEEYEGKERPSKWNPLIEAICYVVFLLTIIIFSPFVILIFIAGKNVFRYHRSYIQEVAINK